MNQNLFCLLCSVSSQSTQLGQGKSNAVVHKHQTKLGVLTRSIVLFTTKEATCSEFSQILELSQMTGLLPMHSGRGHLPSVIATGACKHGEHKLIMYSPS